MTMLSVEHGVEFPEKARRSFESRLYREFHDTLDGLEINGPAIRVQFESPEIKRRMQSETNSYGRYGRNKHEYGTDWIYETRTDPEDDAALIIRRITPDRRTASNERQSQRGQNSWKWTQLHQLIVDMPVGDGEFFETDEQSRAIRSCQDKAQALGIELDMEKTSKGIYIRRIS